MSFKMVKQADTNTSGRQDTFIYDVVETIVDDKIYAELIWDFQNVDSLTINNEPAPHAGFKKMLINKTTRMKFQYTDSKGKHTRRIRIAEEKKSIWLILYFIKALLRPFSFVGYTGQREMKITNIVMSILLLCLVGFFCICNLDYLPNMSDPLVFSEVLRFSIGEFGTLIAILYIWLMQIGRRFKDLECSPYITLLFFPLILVPLVLLHLDTPINLLSRDILEIIFLIYSVYFLVFWITSLILPLQKTKHKKKYQKIKVW